MKKVLWLIVCLMTMVTFTSCSSDVEEDNTAKILGEWEVTHVKGVCDFSDKKVSDISFAREKLSFSVDFDSIDSLKGNFDIDFNDKNWFVNPFYNEIFHIQLAFGHFNGYFRSQFGEKWEEILINYSMKGNELIIGNNVKNSQYYHFNTYKILKLTNDELILRLDFNDSNSDIKNQYIIYTLTHTLWIDYADL